MSGADDDGIAEVGTLQWRRYVLGCILTVVLITVAFRFIWRDWSLFLRLVSIDPWWLVVVSLMLGASLASRTFFLTVLIRELGGRVGAAEIFYLVAATNMLSMLTPPPSGGAYRAVYLRSRHGIGVLPFVSGTALFIFVGMVFWSIVGTIMLISSGLYIRNVSRTLLFVTLVGAAVLIAVWQSKRVLRLMSNGRLDRVARLADGALRGAPSRWVCTAAGIAVVGSAAAQIVGFYAILRLFGLSVSVTDSTSLLAFHQLSGVIGLTPGGVGVQEGAGVLVASGLGLAVTTMVIVFSLIRVVRVTLSILVGGVCWWLLPSEKANAVHEISESTQNQPRERNEKQPF